MGYTTDFDGKIDIVPPLNEKEIEYLSKFADSRRMNRENGEYYVGGTGMLGQGDDEDIIDYNTPPSSQPSLWCQWIPTDDGTAIVWDGNEKFYESPQWMKFLIEHFLKPDSIAKKTNKHFSFLQGHILNGEIYAQGEDGDDCWILKVTDNKVSVVELEVQRVEANSYEV